VTPRPVLRSRRWWLISVAVGSAGTVVAGIALWIASWLARRELVAARAELDRTDPGWRWDDLIAARRPIPDDRNSALRILDAYRRLPSPWNAFETVESAPGEPLSDEERHELEESFNGLMPVQQLRPDQTAALKAEVARLAVPLDALRDLMDLDWGAYPLAPLTATNTVPTSDHIGPTHKAAVILRYRGWLRSQEGQADAALTDGRAILDVARSVGDEPTLMSMLIRLASRAIAVGLIERTLAQGQPSAEALAATQRLAERERAEPVLVWGVRGERAWANAVSELYESGRIGPEVFESMLDPPKSYTGNVRVDRWIRRLRGEAWNPHEQVGLLQYHTRLVEVARLPAAQLPEALARIEESRKSLTPGVRKATQSLGNLIDAYRRSQALLASTAAALAAERFRLATGRWPTALGALVPTYLDEVPPDPFAEGSLRFKRLADGLVIYSVGPDGMDDGGDIRPPPGEFQSKDYGVQLWDPPARRQPPPPLPPRADP
jgi:hypothetical protein